MLNFEGTLTGLGAFLIIGLLHPVVIKGEYRFGKKIWPLFLAAGAVCLALSVLMPPGVLSSLLGVGCFSLLWSIKELFEQEQRVIKGWYPGNPARERKTAAEQNLTQPEKVQPPEQSFAAD